ncbi:alpha/beta fold hydrolase [Nocardiopsis trehalosi]|jgi:pimeloyl-ACP methyl ester carboxylesterase|uniref:alpha/beta fold hydrolase n=1 Tax=Nocardiopsis trehalosi TaxID=109329 RepID=UPI000831AA8A|nr:alpha/beta hydrolase [Nocardiopsis trehalosi]
MTEAAERHRMSVHSADGTRVNVEVHGPEGAPTLVLSHGWACTLAFWAPVAKALGGGLRVVVYDQRGHGGSSAPRRQGYSTAALADDLCAVLEATVPAGTRAVAGGHSMGGMTLMAAADRPVFRDRVAAAALVNTGSSDLMRSCRVVPGVAGRPRLGAFAHRLALGPALPLGPITPLTRAALRYVTLAPGADPRTTALVARMVHGCAPIPRSRWARVLGGLDLDRGVAALDLPTVVVGASLDRLTPIELSRRLCERLPRCERLVEVPNSGHMTPLEQPATVAAVLRDLVDAHLAAPPAAPAARAPQKETA